MITTSNTFTARCLRILGLTLLVVLSGCQSGDDVMIVNLGGTTVPDTPGEVIWLSFKQKAEAAASGRLELRPLIYGQLGSEEQLLSGLRRGRIQFANLSAQVTSTVVPELSLLYAPFLFDDVGQADYVYDTYLTDIYRDLLARQDLHLVTWYEIGFHSVYATAPIILPDDARGKRFRVSRSLNARLFAEAIGADVIPLGFGEIVSSLQTGLIEAGENSVSLYAHTGIAAEAPHYSQTRHSFGISVIVADKKWWDALPAEDRNILTDSFPSIEKSRELTRAQDMIDLSNSSLGILARQLSDQQRSAWKDATEGVTNQLIEQLGGRTQEIHALILKAKTEYAERETGR